jgi:hypothetical protein
MKEKLKTIGIIEDVATLMCYPQKDNYSIIKFSECKYSTKDHPMMFSAAVKNVERVTIYNPKKCSNILFENNVLELDGEFQIHVKGEAIKTTTSNRTVIEVK